MNGILFISSHNTGYGHISITTALKEQLAKLDPSADIEDIDGFSLGGKLTDEFSKLYNQVVLRAPLFWKFYYSLGNVFPGIANWFTKLSMKKPLIKLIERVRPRIIVSVHPCYVGSVLDILEEKCWKIPVVSLVADLDNVSRMWADLRSHCTICPTEKARDMILKYGVPENKIMLTGFPVRDRFNHFGADPGISYYKRICEKGGMDFLIANGSQGLHTVTKMAKELLDSFNCKVTILAGNNKKLKQSIETELKNYRDRVRVCGFINNVEQYMSESDILLLRASPNVLMEAVNLCKPVVITGALTGQEEKNPDYAREHKLGIVCRDIGGLPATVNSLLDSGGKMLDEIYRHQILYRKPEAALEIAEFLLSVMRGNPYGGENEADKTTF